MTMRRKFEGEPVNRLIVSVPVQVVEVIDQLIYSRFPSPRHKIHPARGNRSEFVRLAIMEKLERDHAAIAAAATDSN
jgi:hypothetical protein